MDILKMVQTELQALAEEEYRRFQSALLPGTENLLGVRLPALRKIAVQLCKGDWEGFLRQTVGESFEERMLEGFIIASAPVSMDRRLSMVADFMPKLDNWSVCDSFCSSLKCVREAPVEFFELACSALGSEAEYTARFGVVLLLWYYLDDVHIGEILALLQEQSHPGYYVKMAVAWCLACCYEKFPGEVEAVLATNTLPLFTHNKTIQKIRESRLTAPEIREKLLVLRRGE